MMKGQWFVHFLVMVPFFLPLASSRDLAGQEKKEERKKGFLPPNFGKLGLSDEQKQKIYGIQAKYKAEIEELNKKIKKTTEDQKAEIFSVLSSDQKEKLKEITGFEKKEAPGKAKKNDDGKKSGG
ncbi:MAG: hypothetical protein ACKO26_25050 [Planctomycetota bacterium]